MFSLPLILRQAQTSKDLYLIFPTIGTKDQMLGVIIKGNNYVLYIATKKALTPEPSIPADTTSPLFNGFSALPSFFQALQTLPIANEITRLAWFIQDSLSAPTPTLVYMSLISAKKFETHRTTYPTDLSSIMGLSTFYRTLCLPNKKSRCCIYLPNTLSRDAYKSSPLGPCCPPGLIVPQRTTTAGLVSEDFI